MQTKYQNDINKKDPDDRVYDWDELEPLVRRTRVYYTKDLLRVAEYVWKRKPAALQPADLMRPHQSE